MQIVSDGDILPEMWKCVFWEKYEKYHNSFTVLAQRVVKVNVSV